jgi:hypothetical protein
MQGRRKPDELAKPSHLPTSFEAEELQCEVAEILTRANYRFVSAETSGAIVATKPSGPVVWTLGVQIPRSQAALQQSLKHQLKVVGCDGVVLVCPNLKAVQAVSSRLRRSLRPELQTRVGVTCIRALRLLFQANNRLS